MNLLQKCLFVLLFIGATSAVIELIKKQLGELKYKPEDAVIHTQFHLFTRLNRNRSQIINPSNITKSFFNAWRPVRFIIHGWMSAYNTSNVVIIKDAYLKKGYFNVIIVDWSFVSSTGYFKLIPYIRHIGYAIGAFAKELVEQRKVPFDNMYLIGFSLGAHIAGFAGKHVSPDKFNTIFALDAAGPVFEDYGSNDKLSSIDAKYVESIHTSIRGDWIAFGHSAPLGLASFYPTYGNCQPDCSAPFCSHQRAAEYFAESINSRIGFMGKECNNFEEIKSEKCNQTNATVLMGGEPSRQDRKGIYYVEVGGDSPYAINHKIRRIRKILLNMKRSAKRF